MWVVGRRIGGQLAAVVVEHAFDNERIRETSDMAEHEICNSDGYL